MHELSIWWIIAGMFVITTLLRWIPLCWVQGRELTPVVKRGLCAVPPAIFAALLMYALLAFASAPETAPRQGVAWLAAGLALGVTIRTRSMVWGSLVGLGLAYVMGL